MTQKKNTKTRSAKTLMISRGLNKLFAPFLFIFSEVYIQQLYMMQGNKTKKDWMNNTSSRCGKTMGCLLLEGLLYPLNDLFIGAGGFTYFPHGSKGPNSVQRCKEILQKMEP